MPIHDIPPKQASYEQAITFPDTQENVVAAPLADEDVPVTDQPHLTAESSQVLPVEYKLLTGHARTDGSWKSTDQLHTQYIRLTDELVRQAVDGVDIRNNRTGEIERRPVDYFVWLDKSARPVEWLTHELWPTLARDADGNVPPEPEHKFVNIDRNQWVSVVDPHGIGTVDVAAVDPSIIQSLRSIFLVNPRDRRHGLAPHIDTAPTLFDGKTILIVDEVLSSGRTLRYAGDFFKRAFPEASIAVAHWMGGTTNRGDAVGNADLPVWYSDTTYKGRGIGDRNIDLSLSRGERNENGDLTEAGMMNVQRLGAWFLSVGLSEPDPASRQLRREIHQLAEDAKSGQVFIEPSIHRTEADYDERAVRLNRLGDFEDYRQAKIEYDKPQRQ